MAIALIAQGRIHRFVIVHTVVGHIGVQYVWQWLTEYTRVLETLIRWY